MIVAPILGTGRLVASRQAKLALLREREAELSRLSWRLEFALAASQVGVWDVDLATDQLLWDDRVKALFGYPDRTGFFGEADWAGIRNGLRDEARRWIDVLRTPREVSDVELTGMMASVAHLAYHLGAVRQIHKSVRGPTEGTFA